MKANTVQASCSICGKVFVALSHEDLNKDLYAHGLENHQGELRRAAKRSDETTDPIWVADYISGRST